MRRDQCLGITAVLITILCSKHHDQERHYCPDADLESGQRYCFRWEQGQEAGGALHLVNGGPIFNLDHLVNDDTLKLLDREIGLGMIRSIRGCPGDGTYEIHPDLADPSLKSPSQAMKELEPWEAEALSAMNVFQARRYLKLAKGAYFAWTYTNLLLDDSEARHEWTHKSVGQGKFLSEEAKVLFPRLMDWCFSLPVFREIGRIIIFGSDALHPVTCHRDSDPKKWAHDDNLLLINPRGDRKFYVYDPVKKEKHFASSRAYVFHDLNFHGVDAQPFFNYSVRIDGVYSAEYQEKIKFERSTMAEDQPST